MLKAPFKIKHAGEERNFYSLERAIKILRRVRNGTLEGGLLIRNEINGIIRYRRLIGRKEPI